MGVDFMDFVRRVVNGTDLINVIDIIYLMCKWLCIINIYCMLYISYLLLINVNIGDWIGPNSQYNNNYDKKYFFFIL